MKNSGRCRLWLLFLFALSACSTYKSKVKMNGPYTDSSQHQFTLCVAYQAGSFDINEVLTVIGAKQQNDVFTNNGQIFTGSTRHTIMVRVSATTSELIAIRNYLFEQGAQNVIVLDN